MSRIDLHPEDLIDREADGELSARDEQHLEEHRTHCVACVLEEELRADFADEMEHDDEDDVVLDRVLDRVIPTQRKRRESRPQPLVRIAVAAAVVLISAGAAGAVWQVYVALSDESIETPTPSENDEQVEQDELRDRNVPRRRRGVSSDPEAADPEETVEDPRPSSPEIQEEPPAPETPNAPGLIEPGSPNVSAPIPRSETWTSPTERDAAEIFRRANQARGEGRIQEAARLYRELARNHRGTREEIASRVSLGRLLLDRIGDSRGALQLFDSYLAVSSTGNLAQEARVGRALCLRRLGRRDEEARAWRELLRHHPRSVHATRARERLDELGRSQESSNGVETHR